MQRNASRRGIRDDTNKLAPCLKVAALLQKHAVGDRTTPLSSSAMYRRWAVK
jgi:hypothetical protein